MLCSTSAFHMLDSFPQGLIAFYHIRQLTSVIYNLLPEY